MSVYLYFSVLEMVRVVLIKLRCNSGEHVDLCAGYTRQSMIKYCECPGCWVDCYGRVEVLYGVYGVVVRTFSNQVTS